MTWRRRIENGLLGGLTLLQVALCRMRFPLAGRRRGDVASAGPILVIRCEAKLGDNLLSIPFLRALRARVPGTPIHLLHHAAAREVYRACPYVDERIEIGWPMTSPATLLRRIGLGAALFRSGHVRYSLALVPRWDEDLYAPFLARLSGAPRAIGFSRRVLPEKSLRNAGTDRLLTDPVVDTSVQHESRRPLQLLRLLPGRAPATPPSSALEFWFDARALAKVADRQRAAAPGPVAWIAIAPGAALERRKWPLQRFIEAARALVQRPAVRVLVLGTAAEAADGAAVQQALGERALDLSGALDLQETAAALSTCVLFVGNDSGLLHLAGAVGTPVLEVSCHPDGAAALHPNSPLRFGPTVEPSAVVRPLHPLGDECRDGCAHDQAHCITGVTVDAVERAAAALLARIDDPADTPSAASAPPRPIVSSGSVA